jgi:purine-cytosine permease-like protein
MALLTGELIAATLIMILFSAPLVFGLQRMKVASIKLWQLALVCGVFSAVMIYVFGDRATYYIGLVVMMPLLLAGLIILAVSFIKRKPADDSSRQGSQR